MTLGDLQELTYLVHWDRRRLISLGLWRQFRRRSLGSCFAGHLAVAEHRDAEQDGEGETRAGNEFEQERFHNFC